MYNPTKEDHIKNDMPLRENMYQTISDLMPEETSLMTRMLQCIAMYKLYEVKKKKLEQSPARKFKQAVGRGTFVAKDTGTKIEKVAHKASLSLSL